MCEKGIKAVDARPELHQQYNSWVVESCKQFSWGSGTCHNYYMDDAGRTPFLYPEDYKHFMKMRASMTLDEFQLIQP